MKTTLLALALLCIVSSAVLPFNNQAIDKIFKEKNNALFLFSSTDDASVAAQTAFNDLDALGLDDIVLTHSNSDDGFGLYKRLAEYLGVDVAQAPTLLYLSKEGRKYIFTGEITTDNLRQFVESARAGSLEPYLKSHPIPESNDDHVKIIVGKTFKTMVMESDKEFLIKFYAPWCGHCKSLQPKYDEAARLLANNPNIVLAKVDSTGNEVDGVQISGYPTLKFFRKDKSLPPIDFNGDRDVEGILNWLKSHTEYEWVEPSTEEADADSETL